MNILIKRCQLVAVALIFHLLLSPPIAFSDVPQFLGDINKVFERNWISIFSQSGSKIFFTHQTNEFGLEPWVTDGTAGGTYMIKDIVQGQGSSIPHGYAPITIGGQPGVYFIARTQGEEFELWKTDGTELGTVLVKDINPGTASAFSPFAMATNKKIFSDPANQNGVFIADDGSHGDEVWKTDGTSVGTVMVAEIVPGTGSGLPQEFRKVLSPPMPGVPSPGIFAFSATTAATGTEPYIYYPGLYFGLNFDVYPGAGASSPEEFTFSAESSSILFFANNGVNGRELWRMGLGSASLVKDLLPPGSTDKLYGLTERNLPSQPETFNIRSGSMFSYTSTIYKTDGTAIGTTSVLPLPCVAGGIGAVFDIPVQSIVSLGIRNVFSCWHTATNEFEPWVTDGTALGTTILKDVFPGSNSSNTFDFRRVAANKLLFLANDGTHGAEPWITDGDPLASTTNLFTDFNPGEAGSVKTDIDLEIFFNSLNVTTSATLLPLQIGTRSKLYYTDGTLGNTREILDNSSDTTRSSEASGFTAIGDQVVFAATDGFKGQELFRTTSNPGTISQVLDIFPSGGSSPNQFQRLGNKALFVATDRNFGRELWITDGTDIGTFRLRDINPGFQGSNPTMFGAEIGGRVFFAANDGTLGEEIWVTDGTPAGTSLFMDLSPGAASSSPRWMKKFGERLYLSAARPAEGHELWSTDGTPIGTNLVSDINPGAASSNPSSPAISGLNLIFAATNGVSGVEVWRSNGSSAGTALVKDIDPTPGGSFPDEFISSGEVVFFAAEDAISGRELWRTDGTEAGTFLVEDIRLGSSSATPLNLMRASGGRVIFAANDGVNGLELWGAGASSGSAELLKDIAPGTESSVPQGMIEAFGTPFVYFTAYSQTSGFELWRTDGTPSGTALSSDILPGDRGSFPAEFYYDRGKLYFSAFGETSGEEPFVLEVDQCPDDIQKLKIGVCGCGIQDVDSDGDSYLDCIDACPLDAGKSNLGACGCGAADLDSNSNGAIDCLTLEEFRAQVRKIIKKLGKIKGVKNSRQRRVEGKKRREIRKLLKALVSFSKLQVNTLSARKGISKFNKFLKKARKEVNGAIKAKEGIGTKRKTAKKALKKLIAAA